MRERRRRQGYDTVSLQKAALPVPTIEAEVFDACPDPLAVFDGGGRLLAANAAARAQGAPDPAGEGTPLGQLLPFWGDGETRDRLLSAAVEPGGASNVEVRVTFEEGARQKVFWVSARRLGEAEPPRIVASAREVTTFHAPAGRGGHVEGPASGEHGELRDPGTGFVTRVAFQKLLDQAIEEASGRASGPARSSPGSGATSSASSPPTRPPPRRPSRRTTS